MSDSSDSDFVDARCNAVKNQLLNSGNVEDPEKSAGPSGLIHRNPAAAAAAAQATCAVAGETMKKRRGRKRRKQRLADDEFSRVNFRPEDYQLSEWFIQEMPQKRYFPQIGDEVVYFRQGHEIYLSVVRLKYPRYYVPEQSVPWSSFRLSGREYCRVTKVEFVLHPSRMCKLQLRLTRNGRLSSERFSLYYHPVPEATDFLVLRDVYNVGSLEHWQVGQRFRCAMGNNTWRRGMITAIAPLEQRFPESRFLSCRVRWDDGSVGRLSPWDLACNNHESVVSPRYARIALRREELNAWQGVAHGRDWPMGDRELFLETIAPKLEQLLEMLICEPFVDACHERADPAYLATVAYPVDIGLILLRLDTGFYRRISSLRFDISHMLHNALHFYTPSHSFAKIARLSTDLLTRIIRECSRNVPLKIMYRQSLDAVCYTETETEEDRRTVRRKKKLKRSKKGTDENGAANKGTRQASPLRLGRPAPGNSEPCASRRKHADRTRIARLNWNGKEEKQLASRDFPKKKCRLRDRASRLFVPPVIIELNRSRAQRRASKRRYARHRIVLEEPRLKSEQPLEYACMTLTPEQNSSLVKPDSSTPDICEDCGSLVSECRHRSEEPSTSQAASAGAELERSQPSSSQEAAALEIEHNQPSTSQGLRSNRGQRGRTKKDFFLDHKRATRKRRQDARVTAVRKFPIKRPKESSSSASTTTSSSDSDAPAAFSTFKPTAKRARMRNISKMKEWRADCMRVLQTLWEDEDAAMFRESAMENHRRSVIEWVSLEYIMDYLKSGAYKDPNEVLDEVHTMLLHGRSLISAGNQEVARIIDKLSLLFDELIDPVLRKWYGFTDQVEQDEDQVEYNYMEKVESDLSTTLDEVTSSSTLPESTPPQSPP